MSHPAHAGGRFYIYIYIYIYIWVFFGPVKPELGVIPSGQPKLKLKTEVG